MTKSSQAMRTPLSLVRRLGAAGSGTRDFWNQRVTAIAIAILTLPVIIVLMMLLGRSHAAAVQVLASPLVAIILILFVIATVWHMKIGIQVILEDYVHNEKIKLAAIIANNFFAVAVGLTCFYALLKMSSGV
jgi:succinate dehydrogenase / fumarate reductase membrane anchor subunit